MRNYMYKCRLEDTSLDFAFRLVLNSGKEFAIMLPDQIVFQVFRLVKPQKILFCGHFRCHHERLEQVFENAGNGWFSFLTSIYPTCLGITGLEVYRLSTEENANWLLRRSARQLDYLACEVADLSEFLRAPIKLDRFLAYHCRSVDCNF